MGIGAGWLLSNWLQKNESAVTLDDILRDSFGQPINDKIDAEYEVMNGMPPEINPIQPAVISPAVTDSARKAMAYGTGQAIKTAGKTVFDMIFEGAPTGGRKRNKSKR